MENVANVTYSDRYLFRDPPTENQRLGRAEVFLHELAHMWFGDLVTMEWWNDVWLNESFATYMAYLGLERVTEFSDGWQDFQADMKLWAMEEDQLPTTHRIADQIPTTDETFLNFDGITYGKGASALKQLVAGSGRGRLPGRDAGLLRPLRLRQRHPVGLPHHGRRRIGHRSALLVGGLARDAVAQHALGRMVRVRRRVGRDAARTGSDPPTTRSFART